MTWNIRAAIRQLLFRNYFDEVASYWSLDKPIEEFEKVLQTPYDGTSHILDHIEVRRQLRAVPFHGNLAKYLPSWYLLHIVQSPVCSPDEGKPLRTQRSIGLFILPSLLLRTSKVFSAFAGKTKTMYFVVSLLVFSHRHLDDMLFLNESKMGLAEEVCFVLVVLQNLGFVINQKKSVLSPT